MIEWTTHTMHATFDETSGIGTINNLPHHTKPETVEEAEENVRLAHEHTNGNLKGILAFMPDHYLSAAVTRYYKENAPKVPIAMVADSYFKRMVGNFLMTLANTERPVKLFATEQEARSWLEKKIAV